MTIQLAYQKILARLYEVYDEREAANITDLVVEHFTGLRKIDRITNKQLPLTDPQILQLETALYDLLQYRPVQYVVGEAWFAGMQLYVNENVLIPRPETEELVEWVVEEATGNRQEAGRRRQDATGNRQQTTGALRIIDIGTGSGCIPIALQKKLPHAKITAIDVSAGALEVAKKNAKQQKVDIHFEQVDFLNAVERGALGDFDIIVSNPPYVKQSEESTMNKNVLDHEPNLALFVPDGNALIFYEAIATFAQEHLSKNGIIYLEINEALGQPVSELYKRAGFTDVQVKKDMQGKDRMVRVKKF